MYVHESQRKAGGCPWKEKAATDEFARRQVDERYQKRPAEGLYDIVKRPVPDRNPRRRPQYAGERPGCAPNSCNGWRARETKASKRRWRHWNTWSNTVKIRNCLYSARDEPHLLYGEPASAIADPVGKRKPQRPGNGGRGLKICMPKRNIPVGKCVFPIAGKVIDGLLT